MRIGQSGSCEYSQDLILAQDQIILAIHTDLRAAVFAEKDAIARLHHQRDDLALVVQFSVSDGDHLGLLRFFLGAVRDDDPAAALFLFFQPFHEHPLMERTKVHGHLSLSTNPYEDGVADEATNRAGPSNSDYTTAHVWPTQSGFATAFQRARMEANRSGSSGPDSSSAAFCFQRSGLVVPTIAVVTPGTDSV